MRNAPFVDSDMAADISRRRMQWRSMKFERSAMTNKQYFLVVPLRGRNSPTCREARTSTVSMSEIECRTRHWPTPLTCQIVADTNVDDDASSAYGVDSCCISDRPASHAVNTLFPAHMHYVCTLVQMCKLIIFRE